MEDSLSCTLCTYRYNNDNHLPKILACSHTFCITCLSLLVQKSYLQFFVKCPTCRQVTDLTTNETKKNGPKKLKTNYALLDVVDAFQETKLLQNDEKNADDNAKETRPFCDSQDVHQSLLPLYKEAALLGSILAQKQLAYCYSTGIGGIIQNHTEAFRLYYSLAKQSHDLEAEAWVAYYYLRNYPELNNNTQYNEQEDKDKDAFQLSVSGVRHGKIGLAFYNLGYCYEYGRGVKQNINKAIRIYQRGCGLENSYCQNSLAGCYQDGIGVETDLKIALQLYKQSVNQGNPIAQNNLGANYKHGLLGLKQDNFKAVTLFQLSATQGYDHGQNNLGYCYQYGVGIKQDLNKAIHYYQKSANQGLKYAQWNLAYCYETGKGVNKDIKKAIEFYKLSAKQGNKCAQDKIDILCPEA